MDKWFHSLNKLIQVILLLIPGVNWIVELVIRWSAVLRKGGLISIIVAIVVTFGGLIIGWVDAIWTLLFNKLRIIGKNFRSPLRGRIFS